MTAEQFCRAVRKSFREGKPVEIDGFGLINKPCHKSKIKELEEK